MTKRLVVAAGLVAALAGGTALAAAQAPRGPRPGGAPNLQVPRGGMRGVDLGLRGIQLSDQQREQVRAIMESHRQAFADARTKLREAHRAFTAAAQAATLDEAAIRARSEAVANAMAEEAILRARVRGDVHALLTAEQRQQLTERAAAREKRLLQRQQKMQQRRQQRQPRQPQ